MAKDSELLTLLRDAFLADTALQAWCQAQFAKAPKIFVGMNQDLLPPQEDYPIIVIFSAEGQKGEDKTRKSISIEIAVGVYNDSIDQKLNSETMVGLLQVEDFKDLAEMVIFRAIKGLVSINDDFVVMNFFPFFTINLLVNYEQVRLSTGPIAK